MSDFWSNLNNVGKNFKVTPIFKRVRIFSIRAAARNVFHFTFSSSLEII
jgi:hypothetical protein